jgi:hypothetical protein
MDPLPLHIPLPPAQFVDHKLGIRGAVFENQHAQGKNFRFSGRCLSAGDSMACRRSHSASSTLCHDFSLLGMRQHQPDGARLIASQ